uniref:G-protein coupled receptors family 3 profile domain-containing protein n=1 Tax=Dendroctonus ponderosae TaxID=77166 RepID=A0AAR5PEK1_DENPD
MARAVIQLAAIATCVVLSLTAEDRQARSGDLDRGPPLITDVHESDFFVDERDSVGEESDIGKLNLEPQRAAHNAGPLQFSENVQEPLLVYASSVKIPRDAEPRFGNNNFSGNNFESEENAGAGAQLADDVDRWFLQNLRFKLPFKENASPPSMVDQEKTDLVQQGRLVGSGTPEITFDDADEDAMALKRRLEMSTEFFLVPSSSTPSTSTSQSKPQNTVTVGETERIAGVFRNEVWVVPVLALSAITMVLIVGFEIFVLCKAWRTTPSRRHLFLGQMLLLGLFSCAGLASVFAASPTQFTCALMRFGTGVAYAIVFASLLVKCVFLISLNGGVYLPAPYQGLLLLFAILIQVAIGVQWLLTSPPLVDAVTVDRVIHPNRNRLLVTAADISSTQVIPLCRTPYTDMLLSLIYVIFLIIFVTVLAVKSRGIRDNYREATYIGLSVGCSIPMWLIWTISGLVVSERHRDACIAFGIVIMSIMVFLIMFMPKGRQLAAMGKEGVYIEDREDRFSSLSRAGSGYSPSFFHFKPIKYGMNHATKHQPIATLRAGDLAVCPAPPSYTRLFQYPPGYYSTRYLPGGLYLRPDDGNLYTTLEPTLSSNPNVYFQRGNGLHPGMMY